MFQRIITLTTLFLLVITPMAQFSNVSARPLADKLSIEQQCKVKIEQLIEEVRRSATYDQAGRISSITISVSENEKLGFIFKYDEQSRLLFVIGEDGAQTQFEYDKTGQLQSLLLSSGVRLIYQRDSSGKVIGVKRQPTAKSQTVDSRIKASMRTTRALTLLGAGCDEATKQATLAVIAAGTICVASGLISPACVGALAAAAYLSYLAKKACTDEVEPMENLV